MRRLVSYIRVFIALTFMLFATNLASTSVALADKPVDPGNNNVVCPTGTGLEQVGNNCKVTICHATAAVANPYVQEQVDISAADGNTGNDNGQGDHYANHTGPVFNSSMQQGDTWGDIIPPITGYHSGLNWTADGQAIWNNSCNIPEVVTENTPVTPAAVTFNDPCGTDNDTYTVPTTTGVTYSQTAGTHSGSGSVTITATADNSYVISGDSSWSHTFDDTACVQPETPPVDLCPNIPGDQTTLPIGIVQQNDNTCKVTICHRTAAVNNPYVQETVAVDSVDGNTGNDNGQGDHFAEHTGPVFNSSMQQGDTWGDIIPPVPGIHSGLNWTADGQAIWNNDCQPTTPHDECPNIAGVQPTLPTGMTKDPSGNCVTPGRGGGGEPPVIALVSTTTTLTAQPTTGGVGAGELVNTGESSLSYIFAGMAIIGITAGLTQASRRRSYQ